MSSQGEFDFSQASPETGYNQWIEVRKVTAKELARRINLPIGREVEVWLNGDVRLRGKLQLREELLLIDEDRVRHLELSVDRVHFTYREVESCIRLD